MSSISGVKPINNNSLSQTNALKCKTVICTNDISGNTIVGTPSNYLKNITSNVQTQLNSLLTYDTNNTTTVNNLQTQINNIVATNSAGGTAPVITVGSTTTLAAGSNASVVNSGTATNQVLNFSIPQGIQGNAGITPALSIGSVANL